MWKTPAELHSALNDLPVVLLLASVVCDVLGNALKRESLQAAGFWTLVGAAGGAVLALITGLRAEESIEHGGSVHLVMERHETLAIVVTALLVILAAWRIWRRGRFGPQERPVYLSVAAVGALAVVWTAHIGGTMVYRYGGGIPTDVLEGALEERAAGHTHGPGEEHDDGAPAPADTTRATPDSSGTHTHPPGTPEHEH
jgi:uncharacterized membrane protein